MIWLIASFGRFRQICRNGMVTPIMSAARADFRQVKPQGSFGDRKNGIGSLKDLAPNASESS
jgi:hypothetical protein